MRKNEGAAEIAAPPLGPIFLSAGPLPVELLPAPLSLPVGPGMIGAHEIQEF
jgi:hypothetical protein